MKIYNCDICSKLVYFENTYCVSCGYQLGYLPILDNVSSIEHIADNKWKPLAPQAINRVYKKCRNYEIEKVCNWMIPIEDPYDLCLSCRLNEVTPDLSVVGNAKYWNGVEIAKRRLIYSLLRLGLPIKNKKEDPENGLAFSFLSDAIDPEKKEVKRVITGHDRGLITLNIDEANDSVREKMRLDMNERYRTLLGHFRHEIGHYYWYLLVANNPDLLYQCREMFGDERLDYGEALTQHYAKGAPSNWQHNFISSYASSHPWEDFAESWAHFFHMFDAVETARAWGLSVRIKSGQEEKEINAKNQIQTFEELKNNWLNISTALNSLNRSMGMKDIYPFVWSDTIIQKLSFIQKIIVNFNGYTLV